MNIIKKVRCSIAQASVAPFDKGSHLTRYSMYKRLAAVGINLPRREGRVLSISHSENLIELLGIKATSVVSANYPDCNILNLDEDDESFDFVLSDQVLEHLEGDPFKATAECHRVLKPGGIAVHTTCFINPIHCVPRDFWRFTPDALGLLHENWSEIIECSGWGNFEVWKYINDGLRFLPVPNVKWHPVYKLATKNDPIWPITTWIVAIK